MGAHRTSAEAEAVGAAIRYHRLRAHLSLGDLAASLGTSKGTVSCWENGHAEPSFNNLLRLARVLHVRPSALLTDLDELL